MARSESFGRTRDRILKSMDAVFDKSITTEQGEAIANLAEALNNNARVEIKAVELADRLKDSAHNFGKVMRMGRMKIGDDAEDDDAE